MIKIWHRTLFISLGYRKFCKEIIQYDFDHNPELVSVGSQTEAFQSQYFHTIELYKKEFGIDPPAVIWDATKFKGKIEKINKPKKNQNDFGFTDNYVGTDSLISMFPSVESSDVEFGGGEFGGGGGGGSWGDAGDDSSSSISEEASNTAGSSCSSSCGGD